MKNKELDILNVILSNDANVLKHFQTNDWVTNSDIVNFTPNFEEYINNENINKLFGLDKSVGIDFDYSSVLPGDSITNFNGNLFNIEYDKDTAIDVY